MATKILVPLDGSALAEQALCWAMTLARILPAELVLLRAVEVPAEVQYMLEMPGVDVHAITARMETEATDYLGGLVEQLQDGGLICHPVVRRGPAAEIILDYASQADVDQIVMATHGYSGLKRWTHGSVAERVLQAAQVPLLLVRIREEDATGDRQRPAPCRRMLVPLDGSPVAEQILPTVSRVAKAMGCDLILLQVLPAHLSGWTMGETYLPIDDVLGAAEAGAEAYLDQIATGLEEQGLAVTKATYTGLIASSIVQFSESNGVDLIAMCTHGRTGLARWALGSVADRVLRAGTTPILLVRAA